MAGVGPSPEPGAAPGDSQEQRCWRLSVLPPHIAGSASFHQSEGSIFQKVSENGTELTGRFGMAQLIFLKSKTVNQSRRGGGTAPESLS